MLVSFIIIAYNAEKFLDKSLKSLENQEYPHKNIEVLLVDSMSTDKTQRLFEDFKKRNENDFYKIKLLKNIGKTLPKGWNTALMEVSGEVVLRVDAHTFFDKDFISKNVEEIEKGEDIVGGKCISVTQSNNWKEKLLLIAEESIFGCGVADFRRKEKKEYVNTLAFAMYRKKVFDDVGSYNEYLARTEDNEMHYRMRKKGYKFLLSPNIKTYRYARSDLKGMIKQKYGNGKWIGVTLHFCPKCFSLYHFVPFAFVFGIIFSIIMLILKIPIFCYVLAALYLMFNVINIVLITVKKGFSISYLLLPFVFFVLHCAYGVGTMVGMIEGFFLKRTRGET